MNTPHRLLPRHVERAYSLIEVMVALTIIGILIALSVPSYDRALEQSRADIAGANLQAIWAAERLYWLEYGVYTADMSTLKTLGLLDSNIASGSGGYAYAIQSTDGTTFTATAQRTGSAKWTGSFSVDTTAVVSGAIQASGEADITPGFN